MAATPGTPLQWCGIGVRCGHHWVLRDVQLALSPASVTALVGANGAGKSTMLRCAAGAVRPNKGEILIKGAPVDALSSKGMESVGYMDQRRPLYRDFTIQEMFRLGERLNTKWDMNLAHERMAAAGLSLNWRCGQLSSGQRTQVAIAMAIAKCPSVLLLDEPLSDLDPISRVEFLEFLRKQPTRGTSVVIASHILTDLVPICTHFVVLQRGLVALSNSRAELEHRVTGSGGSVSHSTIKDALFAQIRNSEITRSED